MVRGVSALASALGFTRKTIYEWREKHKDCPPCDAKRNENVTLWREWLEDHPEIGLPGAKPSATTQELRDQNLLKRNTLLDVDIDEARGRLIETAKVTELLTRYLVQAKQSMYKRFC